MTTDEMRRVAEHLERRTAEYYDNSCNRLTGSPWERSQQVECDAAYAWFVLTHERWGRALERLTTRTRHTVA